MMHAQGHDNIVTKPALIAAAALVCFTLVVTTTQKLGWIDREAVPNVERTRAEIAPKAQRRLHFADSTDGSVVITDADTGKVAATIVTGSQQGGFVRGVMRGLARERHLSGIGSAPPFKLTQWQDGSLSLVDEGTGRSIDLGGFGSDNSATFAALLQPEKAS